MGECTCSKIAIMQLFHELKQQFPTLSDHIVAECIAQEGHNRETCARSLRAVQERRPSPGAFPPPGPSQELVRVGSMNHEQVTTFLPSTNSCAHRPATLDVGLGRRHISCTRVPPVNPSSSCAPSGGNPGTFCSQEVFEDSTGSEAAGFEVNVNVACSPVKNTGSVPQRRSDILYEPRPHFAEPYININPPVQGDQNRSFTSVSLTLRPPSSEPQPPIDIRSQRSSLTYSTSSSDPRGFQSRVQISIGPGNVGSVAAARIRPPMDPARPSSLIPSGQYNNFRRSAGPSGVFPSQLTKPTTTMSAPTTPSVPPSNSLSTATSLPTTPVAPRVARSPSPEKGKGELAPSNSSQMTEHQRKLIAEQLERKERLAREVEAEKGRLEAMKKEIEMLLRPFDSSMTPEAYKEKLQKEIVQLQSECNRMANEIDRRSEPGVPLGETNEEFYQGIYTGQRFVPRLSNLPPPLPAEPPVWQIPSDRVNPEERDGPSWVCRMCTFSNHPLMKRCEQCELPRIMPPLSSGETQDIHIRVTHHHNFSPRTVHSWVV